MRPATIPGTACVSDEYRTSVANLQIDLNTQLRAMHIDFWNTTYISIFYI